jgi:hypothetical protein
VVCLHADLCLSLLISISILNLGIVSCFCISCLCFSVSLSVSLSVLDIPSALVSSSPVSVLPLPGQYAGADCEISVPGTSADYSIARLDISVQRGQGKR